MLRHHTYRQAFFKMDGIQRCVDHLNDWKESHWAVLHYICLHLFCIYLIKRNWKCQFQPWTWPVGSESLSCNRLWWTFAFLPLLTSSLLTKIGIIYTQLLQEEKIFPMMPRSEWSVEWSLRYAQQCSDEWKTQKNFKNFLALHLAAPC